MAARLRGMRNPVYHKIHFNSSDILYDRVKLYSGQVFTRKERVRGRKKAYKGQRKHK
jgi:hypothetical protein